MKKIITFILIGLVIGILVFVFWPEKNQPAIPDTTVEQLTRANRAVIHDWFESIRVQDSLKRDNQRRDSIEKRLRKEIAAYQSVMDKNAAKIIDLAGQVKALKMDSTKDHLCDELADEAVNFANMYSEYKGKYDSLTINYDSTKANMFAALADVEARYGDLMKTYDKLFIAYQGLIADQATLNRSLRRQKLKTKLGVILGIAGGLLLPK